MAHEVEAWLAAQTGQIVRGAGNEAAAIVVVNVVLSICMIVSTYGLYAQSIAMNRDAAATLATTQSAMLAACSMATHPSNSRILTATIGATTLDNIRGMCGGTKAG